MLWITPSLVINPDWPSEDLLDADEATSWIQTGGTAHVTDEATAVQVLDNLGLTEREIEDRLHFARTGQVLTP
jgi:hypothetical protein